jgi:CBS domain-containing protein
MRKGVLKVHKDDSLLKVLELLDAHHVSAVIVEDSSTLSSYYIITESDLIHFLKTHPLSLDLTEIQAGELMNGPLVMLDENTPIETIIKHMIEYGKKRVVIQDEKHHPIGMISTSDILAWNNAIFHRGHPVMLMITDNASGIILAQKIFRQEVDQSLMELFGGSLNAISNILGEVLSKSGYLRVIEKDNYCVMLEPRERFTGVLIVDNQSIKLRKKLKRFTDIFLESNNAQLQSWIAGLQDIKLFQINPHISIFEEDDAHY